MESEQWRKKRLRRGKENVGREEDEGGKAE